jgi:small subunit ribosomal protein S9
VIEEDERQDTPQEPEETPEESAPAEEQPAPEQPAEEEPAPEQPAEEQPAAEQPAEEQPAEEQPAAPEAAEPAEGEQEGPRPKRARGKDRKREDEVIPGEHLEPDLVLEEEEQRAEGGMEEFAGAQVATEGVVEPEAAPETPPEPEPVAHEPLDLAADARYQATGKRKTAVARVILRPGSGSYTVNGRGLDQFFPRIRLQKIARQPLDTAGYGSRMDVVARIHGGGVSAQAGALRHGIARALVEADPTLRVELKRAGFLTRDPREKERKKAGLKKARKRPQFSKR